MLRLGKQRSLNRGAVAIESEVICGVFEPVEMQFDERIFALPEQRFDQGEGFIGAGEKLRLQLALAEFVGGIGVDDDAAAHAHRCRVLPVQSSVRMATLKTVAAREKKPMAPV